jgi:hypothetical protein
VEEVIWEEPPSVGRHAMLPRPTQAQLDALRAQPGRWARLCEYSNVRQALSIAQWARRRLDAADYQFRTAADRDAETSRLYGRYVGDVLEGIVGQGE